MEPWAQTYNVEPDGIVSIVADFSDTLQPVSIDYWSENFIAIWVPAGTKVMSNGVALSPLADV